MTCHRAEFLGRCWNALLQNNALDNRIKACRLSAISEVGKGAEDEYKRLLGLNQAGELRAATRSRIDALSLCLCRR